MLSKIILTCLLIFPTLAFASVNCLPEGIANVMTVMEASENAELDEDEFRQAAQKQAQSQFDYYDKFVSLEQIRIAYLDRQDYRYEKAIEYLSLNLYNDLNYWSAQEILDNFSDEEDDFMTYDLFIAFTKDDIMSSSEIKKRIIPTSTLFKSWVLDNLVYSCVILNKKHLFLDLWAWRDIRDALSDAQDASAYVNEEIRKQREANRESIIKYWSFVRNYKIHQRLVVLIDYYNRLMSRFKDLSRMIWAMPAKIVNFWFEISTQ